MSTAAHRQQPEQPEQHAGRAQLSLGIAAARNLATTTKTVPQMQGTSSRWLLRMLPWVEVKGGTYRVNRRLVYEVGDGRVTFVQEGAAVRVIPAELGELPLLRGFDDGAVLRALAERCRQEEYGPGEVIAERGRSVDHVYLIARGKVEKVGTGKYGEETRRGVLADGGFFGAGVVAEEPGAWEFTARAMTACTVLALPRAAYEEVAGRNERLRAHVRRRQAEKARPQNKKGEANIALASGHTGEPALPGTFVDYELAPREYELSVAQTVLRVHSRVADLYNDPMDQVEQQLRLTIEALRERQEAELVNNPDFGLLHNADHSQRISTHSGPPTPDDMDELLSMRRGTKAFFAHPRAVSAFARECNKRGLSFDTADVGGRPVPAWRGVPIFPCGKIPVSDEGTSSILAMRLGEAEQGVVGLRQTGIPDEYEPGLNVRFMGINDQALISYLVSTYHSAAVLVPDALGVLENVEVFHTPS
ncbi:cyclic nucleotide-binding domain-containing protein [Streptomyces sp. SCA3-4]|uniref:family 2B encapsulin nanocompartment shell protein n=1 Tax=Streptomyces sichuanensis TaxID=2871810 RepID=UPI001CE2C1B4|nr:family 2B encapsulin nanocompartment shell protein [Streptomyces sichuanensis]MCA6093782.1 cyclic nucleotide-binding domain-containing protein [Streptomyces sichuanensis]